MFWENAQVPFLIDIKSYVIKSKNLKNRRFCYKNSNKSKIKAKNEELPLK